MPKRDTMRTSRRSDAQGVSLIKRRRWYSSDTGGDDPQEKSKGNLPSDSDTVDLDSLPESTRKYISELRGESKDRRLEVKELKRQIAEIEGKLNQAEEAQKQDLEKKGDFEALSRRQEKELAELRLKVDRAERLEALFTERNTKMVERLPEHTRVLYPATLPPEKQAEWLENALTILITPAIPNMDGGAGGQTRNSSSTSAQLTADEKRVAAASGLTEEQYAAAKK